MGGKKHVVAVGLVSIHMSWLKDRKIRRRLIVCNSRTEMATVTASIAFSYSPSSHKTQNPVLVSPTTWTPTPTRIPVNNTLRNLGCGLLAALAISTASPSSMAAANPRLPPLSTDPNRCEQAFTGNTIGQANGVYDKAIDLRFCDFSNDKSNIKGKSLAAALMSGAKFDGADLSEVVMSKAYAVGASFRGVNFRNAVLDRVNFGKANLQGAVFTNAVLSGSTFVDADLKDATFDDTIIGYIDLQNLCLNTTLEDDAKALLGCR